MSLRSQEIRRWFAGGLPRYQGNHLPPRGEWALLWQPHMHSISFLIFMVQLADVSLIRRVHPPTRSLWFRRTTTGDLSNFRASRPTLDK
jgi:hypothetical protein